MKQEIYGAIRVPLQRVERGIVLNTGRNKMHSDEYRDFADDCANLIKRVDAALAAHRSMAERAITHSISSYMRNFTNHIWLDATNTHGGLATSAREYTNALKTVLER